MDFIRLLNKSFYGMITLMADKERSDFYVAFTIILCGANFFVQ